MSDDECGHGVSLMAWCGHCSDSIDAALRHRAFYGTEVQASGALLSDDAGQTATQSSSHK